MSSKLQWLRRWFYDGEGDLNPTLLLTTLFGVMGLRINEVIIVAYISQPTAAIVIPALLAFDLSVILAFMHGWVSVARLKIMANSKPLAASARALGEIGSQHANVFTDNETDGLGREDLPNPQWTHASRH